MSDIQRYDVKRLFDGEGDRFVRSQEGLYCRYTDLQFYRRQYHMAVTVLVVVCAVFAAFLVTGKYAPQPVHKAMVETSQPWQTLSNKIDQIIKTHQQAVANYDTAWKDREKRDRDWAKRVANLEAQIKAQNALLNPAQQTDVLKQVAKPMHDGALFKLAKSVGGFTKIRVIE